MNRKKPNVVGTIRASYFSIDMLSGCDHAEYATFVQGNVVCGRVIPRELGNQRTCEQQNNSICRYNGGYQRGCDRYAGMTMEQIAELKNSAPQQNAGVVRRTRAGKDNILVTPNPFGDHLGRFDVLKNSRKKAADEDNPPSPF